MIRTRALAYHGVKSVGFSEYLAKVVNEGFLSTKGKVIILCMKIYLPGTFHLTKQSVLVEVKT